MTLMDRDLEERRRAATSKLVVLDLASVFPDWLGPVPPSELVARSVLVRTLAEARRDQDVFLIGCTVDMAWAAAEVFPGAAIFIEPEDASEERELSGQFLDRQRTGSFAELVIVSGDRRFLEVAEMFGESGRTVRVLTDRDSCDIVLNGEADVTVYFPDFND